MGHISQGQENERFRKRKEGMHLTQTAGRTHPGLVIELYYFGLYPADKEKHSPCVIYSLTLHKI